MKSKKVFLSLLTIVMSIATLGICGISYSWIRRDWSPKIYDDNLLIETSGSLALRLENTTSVEPEININSITSMKDFTLKQVSSGSGNSDDFFKINYDDGICNEKLEYLERQETETYTNFSSKNGYIEIRFMITSKSKTTQGSQLKKYIFIDSYESYINSDKSNGIDVSEAIRVGITVEGKKENGKTGNETNYLFKKTAHTRDNGGNITGQVPHVGAKHDVDSNGKHIANGLKIYDVLETIIPGEGGAEPTVDLDYKYELDGITKKLNPDAYETNNDVYEFSDFNGGMITGGAFDNDDFKEYFNKDKALFSLAYIEQRWLRVRLWLEGYDANCIDGISGSQLQFKLLFRSFDIDESKTQENESSSESESTSQQ